MRKALMDKAVSAAFADAAGGMTGGYRKNLEKVSSRGDPKKIARRPKM
ncbi:hypothetical protein [Desulfitobacterium hafniense]|nr:hypothetical protein [Desulfitobacterium hafniense]